MSEQQKLEQITFSYKKANGQIKIYKLQSWVEVGHYLQGFSLGSSAIRTFRKDRIVEYLDNNVDYILDPHPEPPTINQKKEQQLSIVFTGFMKAVRTELEQKAAENNLHIPTRVTKDLTFLCVGANAGPAKVKKAREQNAYIMDQTQFLALLETGELPDEEPEWLKK